MENWPCVCRLCCCFLHKMEIWVDYYLSQKSFKCLEIETLFMDIESTMNYCTYKEIKL